MECVLLGMFVAMVLQDANDEREEEERLLVTASLVEHLR